MSTNHLNNGENGVKVPRQLIRRIRNFMHDNPSANKLLGTEIFSDMQLAEFLVDEVDAWNYTPPIAASANVSPISLVANPAHGAVRKWMIDAVAARALKSFCLRAERNDMPYTAGNVTIQPDAVWRNIQPSVQDLELQYKEFRQNYKIALNSEAAYGTSHSEFNMGMFDNREGFLVVHL